MAQETKLEIRRVALRTLAPDPANARAHGEVNLDAIEASLRRFGQAEPLVVQAGTQRLIAGHGRLAAMKSLGWPECDIVEIEVDDLQATALGIALNRTAELAGWDEPVLARLLTELRVAEALEGVGYSVADLDELLAELQAQTRSQDIDDPGPGELPEHPISKVGDMWLLGEHRLLCGDSTEAASFKVLLGGDAVDLVWTDPPYGVRYVGGTDEELTIANDALDGPELAAFLRAAFAPVRAATKPGAVWYVAAPSGPNFLPFAQVLTELEVWRQTLVWVKDALVLGHSDFHYRHEALFYGWSPGAAHREPPDRTNDTVWEFPRPKVSREHPTMKPVALVAHSLELSSKPGDLVLDPFCGSGTTLLACEAKSRRGRGIELDPRYCDAAVKRWEIATGKTTVLDGDGRSFTEVAAERRGPETGRTPSEPSTPREAQDAELQRSE